MNKWFNSQSGDLVFPRRGRLEARASGLEVQFSAVGRAEACPTGRIVDLQHDTVRGDCAANEMNGSMLRAVIWGIDGRI